MNRKMITALLAAASLGGLAHLTRKKQVPPPEAVDTGDLPVAIAEPRMDSAGAELMNIGWKMKEHPDFAAHWERVHEIGAWVSMGRSSDMERMVAPVLGQIIGAMHKRGIPFDDGLPMTPQFTDFLESLPDPLPGQKGYVDQATLAPMDRRDAFEATVTMSDVRHWTASDGIARAIARTCTIRPTRGVAGSGTVFAEQDVTMLKEGTATMWLRSTGGGLTVVPAPAGRDAPEEPVPEIWGEGPISWNELVNLFYSLRLTLERRARVTDPMDQLRLELELRSFTVKLFERMKKVGK